MGSRHKFRDGTEARHNDFHASKNRKVVEMCLGLAIAVMLINDNVVECKTGIWDLSWRIWGLQSFRHFII